MRVFVNGQERQVEAGSRLLDVLEAVDHGQAPRGVAVALDGTVVARGRVGETALHEGARVEIVTAVQGG